MLATNAPGKSKSTKLADESSIAASLTANYGKQMDSSDRNGGPPNLLLSTPTSARSGPTPSNPLTLFAEDSPAKTSAWLDDALAWLANAPDYGSDSIASLLSSLPVGFSSRTSLAFSRATEARTWPWFSEGWKNSGMGGPTGCLTLNTSEWPKDAAVCSLSDVLETRPVPSKFFLSPKAASGILRRAERRGRALPTPLREALSALAEQTTTTHRGGALVPVSTAAETMEAFAPNLAHTLSSAMGKTVDRAGKNGRGPVNVIAYPLDMRNAGRSSGTGAGTQGDGIGDEGDPSFAITGHTLARPAVAAGAAVRRLTPIECERLQGFPDDWTAGESDSTRYRQLGNAVCVPVAEWIGRRFTKPNACEPEENTNA